MLSIDRLIAHRFRGFAARENTLQGLRAALDAGVLNLEFDIRVTRCGTPIIYHDEHAKDKNGRSRLIADILASDLSRLGGDFAHMPLAETLFQITRDHPNQAAKLLIDIKDAGFEAEINALVHLYGLQTRTIYVSWLPDVLYRLHDMVPDIPLCLSHWCQKPNAVIRKLHRIDTSRNGHIPRGKRAYIHGERCGWFVDGVLKGEMLDILKRSQGAVCVPQDMISKELSDYYQGHDIKVSTFSYIDWTDIMTHNRAFNIDLYFVDNKRVFDEIA